MIYSLIPAKVNSSRLPYKNTFKFMLGSKPLIAYTVEAVKNAGIKPIVFTNEFNNGKDLGNTWGADIVGRSDKICLSTTTMKDTARTFINIKKLKKDDIILLTYLTCPFRTSNNIKEAIKLFYNNDASSLQSLTAVDYRPFGLLQKKNENKPYYTCMRKQSGCYQQQNTPKLYKANGAIYIFKVSELEHLNNQMFNSWTIGYELDTIQGLDIDTELDYMFAQKIIEERVQDENFAYKLPSEGNSKTEFNTTRDRLHSEFFETSRT